MREIDEFVVMPNHVHGIIMLSGRGDPCDRPVVCVDNPLRGQIQGDHEDRPSNTRISIIRGVRCRDPWGELCRPLNHWRP